MGEDLRLLLVMMLVVLTSGLVVGQELNVSLDYPGEVRYDEEFDMVVRLEGFEEDVYDVKFEIVNGSKNIAERFYKNEWKSSNFWMNQAINSSENSEGVFRILIDEIYNGLNNFSVKIRNQGDFYFEMYGLMNISSEIIDVDDGVENNDSEGGIDVVMDWDEDDVVNGKRFDVEIVFSGLEDKEYDIRLWVEDEDNVMSDRRDDRVNEWKSGKFYLDNFVVGPGNYSGEIKLRIREDYRSFSGNALLFVKLREGFIANESIEILEKEDEVRELEIVIPEKSSVSGDVVRLDTIKLGKDVETIGIDNVNRVEDLGYRSSTEIVKSYSLYAFALLCVIMSILVMFRKLE